MVAWTGDGTVTGYDPSTKKPGQVFRLATSGTVDTRGQTRYQYELSPAYNRAVFPELIEIQTPITFTSADIAANPGKGLSMGLFAISASWFPEGKVPTPAEIVAMGASKYSISWGDFYWTSIPAGSPQTRTFVNHVSITGLPPGKFWLLATPVAVTNPSGPYNPANIKPMLGVNVNSIGRAISIVSSQRPTTPVITSPASGTVVPPGTTINLAYTPGDPDKQVPDDAERYNRDLAAVQIQYAALPSQANPSPPWKLLPFKTAAGIGQSEFARGKGSTAYNSPHDPNRKTMLTNLSLPIHCGVDDAHWDVSKAMLPGGDWQIRVRTMDFGHPFPGSVVDPLGVWLTSSTRLILDSYPDPNTSPWSDPIRVSIPSQVPPPIPLSPTQDIAVESADTVRLSWQYRNTFTPPFPQKTRSIQVRKIGDPAWHTVFRDSSAASYVDLPSRMTFQPNLPTEYASDPGFENGTTDGWVKGPAASSGTDGSETLTNVATNPRTGTRALRMNYTKTGTGATPIARRTVTLQDKHDRLTASLWVDPDPAGGRYIQVLTSWLDINGAVMSGSALPDESQASGFVWAGGTPSGYLRVDLTNYNSNTTIMRPPGGVSLRMDVYCFDDETGYTNNSGFYIDDWSVKGFGDPLEAFTFEPTNEYEWRVQVSDADGKVSNYSDPGRFWIVDPAGSGVVRDVPTETIDGATLGCGSHRAFIYRRGGKARVGEIRGITYLDWARVRDDLSTAKVEVKDWDIDCGNLLANLHCWAYELVIFRDNGYSVDRVWEGPITLLTYETDKVTIQAKDVMAYSYRRIIKQRMSDAGTGDTVVNRATRVLQNAYAPDDPNVLSYLTPLRKDDDAREYRSTPAYSRTAFEEVDDMAANAGLDYTTVGRSIMLWGTKHRIGTLPEFTDNDLGSPPIVSEYGMSMANRYAVSDGNGVWGEATRLDVSGNDPTYGLVEMLSSTWASDSTEDSGTYTQAGLETMRQSFAEFAERSIADRYPNPAIVRVPDNTTLNPSALISIQQLVPGVVIPLRSTGTLRTIVASQKLDSIKVVEEGGRETISITMSPFSRDDAATDEGETV